MDTPPLLEKKYNQGQTGQTINYTALKLID